MSTFSLNKTEAYYELLDHGLSKPLWMLGVKYQAPVTTNTTASVYYSMEASFMRRPIQRQQDSELDVEVVTVSEEAEKILRSVLDDFESLLWFSYRKDFIPIGSTKDSSYWTKITNVFQSSGYTSDAGWGCMLRTGQMMLAHALRLQYLGREWRLPFSFRSSYKSKNVKKVHPLMSLRVHTEVEMEDSISKNEIEAIHSSDGALVVTGSMEKELPPQYHMILGYFLDKPECPFSIQKVAEVGTMFGKKVGEWFGPTTIAQVLQKIADFAFKDLTSVYVADQGTMYVHQVLQQCMSDSKTFTPVVLLFPIRLGLDKLNMVYHAQLAKVFEAPGTLGIIGGKPRSSLYFVGHQGDEFVYLDPHIVQKSCADARTYHYNGLQWTKVEDIDPSLCLGFFCKTKKDLDLFISYAQQHLSTKSCPLVSFVHNKNKVVAKQQQNEEEDDDDLVIV